jgi:ADP-heptose:LPS heptosyltransferase
MIRAWIGRADLIGDCVMALPMLYYIDQKYPKSYKVWPILRKCSQAAPLFLNHPLIDKIHISDHDEGFGENDKKMFHSCSLRMDVRPQHPMGEYWHNDRSMVEETWIMGGLPLKGYHELPEEEKYPKLYKWFNTDNLKKTIAVHCFAGYGRDNKRSPSLKWWEDVLSILTKDYNIIRLGHPSEPQININFCSGYSDIRSKSFFEQVQTALSCSLYIGTDSGFSLAVGAYSHPQISLITNWNVGHHTNFLCLQPLNKNNISLFSPISCDNIKQEEVLNKVKLFNV